MNTPNKLTVARMVISPILMATLLIRTLPYRFTISLVLFILGSITDYIDGHLARKYHIVTNFGKFLDPLSDKMLTTTAFIGMMAAGIGETLIGWSVILFITLFREFLIASLRLVTVSSGGKVVAANWWGKTKTVLQMVSIIVGLAGAAFAEFFTLPALYDVLMIVTAVLLWAGAVLCAVSGAVYVIDCKSFIDPRK